MYSDILGLGTSFARMTAVFGFLLGLLSLLVRMPVLQFSMLVTAGAMVMLGLSIYLYDNWRGTNRVPRSVRPFVRLIKHDHTPQYIADGKGKVRYQNGSSAEKNGPALGRKMARTLGDLFANPDAVVFRLQARASQLGAAQEDIETIRKKLRVSVQSIGKSLFVWRLEDMTEATGHGKTMALATVPRVSVAPDGSIKGYNEALRTITANSIDLIETQLAKRPLDNGTIRTLQSEKGSKSYLVARQAGTTGGADVFLFPIDTRREGQEEGTTVGVDSLPVPLMLIDADGKVRDVNTRAVKLIDRPVDRNVFVSDVFEGLGRSVSDWLADAQAGRGGGRPEVLKVNHPNKEVFLQVSLARMDGRVDGHEGSLLAVLNDATELKTLEAQFVQSQKMQAIGQLAGGVAHDFNNLLTAISGHCDLLLLRHDQNDPDYADLVQIHQNANRAASLVGQLLAFSRKQNLQPEVLDLRDTLSDLTHLLNRLVGEKVQLRLIHDSDLASIRADKRQLEQVLMNLVVNARDAMPDGGEISISTSTVDLKKEIVRHRAVVPAGKYIIVNVTDEGVGIPADKLPKIFEPFYTTKRTGEGTGLGLSTAYGIVKQTGGYIFAESELGKGTVFSLYFPVHKAVPGTIPPDPKPVESYISKPGEGVILLVEDEAPVRAFASRALQMRGYKVIEAENAEEALETLKDTSLEIDVFVTDVIMPGLDGPTWVREALKTRPDTKVIFVSGYAEESLTDKQSRIPNSVFLPKPFSLNELATTVMQQTH